MTPEYARKILGAFASTAVITARTTVNYYGGAWVIYARIAADYERPLTQFAANDPWHAARWINDYERLRP